MTRKRYAEVMAAEARRRASWDAVPTLIKLRIQLDEFSAERDELRDFSNHIWAQRRSEELTDLIARTERKIARWEESERYRAAHGLTTGFAIKPMK